MLSLLSKHVRIPSLLSSSKSLTFLLQSDGTENFEKKVLTATLETSKESAGKTKSMFYTVL